MSSEKEPSLLERSWNILPPAWKAKWEKNWIPRKFQHEKYVSKNAIIKKDEDEKNKGTLKHKLLTFNDVYYREKILIEQMKDYSLKFNRQYAQILQVNEEKPTNVTNHYLEIFKKRGYNVTNIDTKENVFLPSIWLDIEANYLNILPTISERNIKQDVKYLGNCENNLKLKANSNSTRIPIRDSDMQFSLNIGGEEVTRMLNPIQLKKDNRKMRRDIRLIQKTIKNDEKERENFTSMSTKEDFANNPDSFTQKIIGKKLKIDGIFLSSKGMIRSAKKKKERKKDREWINKTLQPQWTENKDNDNNKKKEDKIEKNENPKDDNKRWNSWKGIFDDIKCSDYISEEEKIKKYLKAFRKEVNWSQSVDNGSNWHGFWGDFKRHTQNFCAPEMAKLVSTAKLHHGYKGRSDDIELKAQELDDEINALDYDYTRSIWDHKK